MIQIIQTLDAGTVTQIYTNLQLAFRFLSSVLVCWLTSARSQLQWLFCCWGYLTLLSPEPFHQRIDRLPRCLTGVLSSDPKLTYNSILYAPVPCLTPPMAPRHHTLSHPLLFFFLAHSLNFPDVTFETLLTCSLFQYSVPVKSAIISY